MGVWSVVRGRQETDGQVERDGRAELKLEPRGHQQSESPRWLLIPHAVCPGLDGLLPFSNRSWHQRSRARTARLVVSSGHRQGVCRLSCEVCRKLQTRADGGSGDPGLWGFHMAAVASPGGGHGVQSSMGDRPRSHPIQLPRSNWQARAVITGDPGLAC